MLECGFTVDDFGIKYFCKDDLDYLLDTLHKYYKISVDMDRKNYCGLSIYWNYPKRFVDISMPGFTGKTRERLQYKKPSKPQHAPHKWNKPAYGQKTQLVPINTNPLLSKEEMKYVQKCVGALLYYARAVDPCILPAINKISGQQAKPTEQTMEACTMLLDYVATYPDAIIRYHASDMVLHVDSDVAYLVLPNARSCYAGHFFLGDTPPLPPAKPSSKPNGTILTNCKTIRGIMASAAETETGGMFGNAQDAIVVRIALLALGHKQPATPIKTDNSTCNSFVHSNIHQRRSKTWDMHWTWLRHQATQEILRIYWDKGVNNDGDYFTKYHPPTHHKVQRPRYVLQAHNIITSDIPNP